jgi:hypothetical protein
MTFCSHPEDHQLDDRLAMLFCSFFWNLTFFIVTNLYGTRLHNKGRNAPRIILKGVSVSSREQRLNKLSQAQQVALLLNRLSLNSMLHDFDETARSDILKTEQSRGGNFACTKRKRLTH